MKTSHSVLFGTFIVSAALFNSSTASSADGATKMLGMVATDSAPVNDSVQRAALADQLVAKWALHAEKNYQLSAGDWQKRMQERMLKSSLTTLRSALNADSFESMNIALMSEAPALTTTTGGGTGNGGAVLAKALGDLSQDLVYNPVAPCRIVDTRLVGGPIAAGFSRDFRASNVSDFSIQGGSASNCGTAIANVTAIALNFTVVGTGSRGFLTAYAFGTTRPLAATMVYEPNGLLSNFAVIPIPSPTLAADFSVFTAGTTNLVVDIVGYYAPPRPTALDCTTISSASTNVAAGAYSPLPVMNCAATYTPVSLSISAAENIVVADSYTAGNAGQIFVRSLSVNAQGVTGKLTCCRVPGR